ncbi:transglutaminaseTgpA domain-containing protein [Streptomyces sp. NPDC005438]|uniref:transglutaminase family protein n=1 Tax=Streptomyces sp. NPDC005438 TaxID=3156880 RepID=UPI0033B2CD51
MSGRARMAFCSLIATLAAACSLLPLVSPASWLFEVGLLLSAQTVVGALTRRIPLARPLTVLVQLLVSVMLVTFFFAREQALFGLIPGPNALEQLNWLLVEGTDDISRFTVPAPTTTGIRLILVVGILLVGLLVDMLAVTYRSAAPAGLPLLALYSVAAGLFEGGARWLWFLCAAGGYLLLLLAEGRERLSQWGRVFSGGPDPRYGSHQPGGVGGHARAPVRTGRRIGALSLGIALVVPATLPSLGGGLLEAARQDRGSNGQGGTISAVNPLVALQDNLNQSDDRVALTYRTTAESTQDMYLRIVSLDRFDGASWRPSERRIVDLPSTLPAPSGLDPDVSAKKVRTSVRSADWYAQNWLPMPYPAEAVRTDGRWRYEPEGRTLVGDRGQTTRDAQYEVDSLQVRPSREQLAEAPQPPRQVLEEYTSVPESLPSIVERRARQVTRDANNDYERAVRLQDWFSSKGGFTYDTEVRAGSGSAAIVNFLEQKEGFCVHFAFSMAAMSRTLGIPARVAVGFTPGTPQSNGGMAVSLKDAHAWPELYFEGVGWTRFEPTPSRGNVPSYTVPDESDQPDTPESPAPDPENSEQPAPRPSASDDCTAEQKRSDPQCGAAAPTPDSGQGGGGPPWQALTLASAALLLLLVPLSPMLWRSRRRASRLAASRDETRTPRERVLAAWSEVVDSAWDFGVVPDAAETPRGAAARIVRVGELGPSAAERAHALALLVERALYAEEVGEVPDLTRDVHRVREELAASSPRGVRLRARMFPRSSVRVRWRVADALGGLRQWFRSRWTGVLRTRSAR